MSFEWLENRKKLEGRYKTLSEKQSQDIKFSSTNYETIRASSKWLDEKSNNYRTVYSTTKQYKTLSPKNKFVSDLRKKFKEFQKKTNIKLKLEDKAYITHHQFGNFNKDKNVTSNYATIDNFNHKFISNQKSIKNPKIHYNTSTNFFTSLQTQTQNLKGQHLESESNKNFYKKLLKGRLLKIISQSIVLKHNEIESYKNKKKEYMFLQMQQDHIAQYRKDKNLGIITQKIVELFPLRDIPLTSRCEDLYLTPNELLLNNFTSEELKTIKSDPIYFQLNKGAFRDIKLLRTKALLETLDEEDREQENKKRLRNKSNGTIETRIMTSKTNKTNHTNNTNKTSDALRNENNSNDTHNKLVRKDNDIQSFKSDNFSEKNITNEKNEVMALSWRKNKIKGDDLKDNFTQSKILPVMKSNKLHVSDKLVKNEIENKNENEFVTGNKPNSKDSPQIKHDKVVFNHHIRNPLDFFIKNNSIATKTSNSKHNSKSILKFETITLHKLSNENSTNCIIIDDNNKDILHTIRQNNNSNSNINKQKLQEESIWRDSYVNKIKENYLSSHNKH